MSKHSRLSRSTPVAVGVGTCLKWADSPPCESLATRDYVTAGKYLVSQLQLYKLPDCLTSQNTCRPLPPLLL